MIFKDSAQNSIISDLAKIMKNYNSEKKLWFYNQRQNV